MYYPEKERQDYNAGIPNLPGITAGIAGGGDWQDPTSMALGRNVSNAVVSGGTGIDQKRDLFEYDTLTRAMEGPFADIARYRKGVMGFGGPGSNVRSALAKQNAGLTSAGRGANQMYNQYSRLANDPRRSYVNKAANAQRNQAQHAIQQQALMASRGGMGAGAQRAAIMGASGTQANMAGQVAAARAQERAQAMQGMMQANQMRGNIAQARGQQAMNMGNIYGGAANMAQRGLEVPAGILTSNLGK